MPLPPPQPANIASTANPNAYLSRLFRPRIAETIRIKIVTAKVNPRHWNPGRRVSQFGFLSIFGSNQAEVGGTVMVSVELTEALPGVAEVGLSTQVGVGAGPVTVQLSWITEAKEPFCGAMVIISVPCLLASIVRVGDMGVSEKSGDGGIALVTVYTVPKFETPPELVVPNRFPEESATNPACGVMPPAAAILKIASTLSVPLVSILKMVPQPMSTGTEPGRVPVSMQPPLPPLEVVP